jgi:hypothetical protein
MKFIIIPYIALGLVLSLVFGIEYKCNGPEMFATQYGSPFIFKRKSDGSSLTYFYCLSGLIINVFLWSTLLYLANKAIEYFKVDSNNSILFQKIYKFAIGLMIVFTTLNIALDYMMLGNGFEENLNYWYWDTETINPNALTAR